MNVYNVTEDALRLKTGVKWNHYPEDVLPAWIADMDFQVAQPIKAALSNRIESSDFGYPLGQTQTGLPDLFCERVKQKFDWHIKSDDVLLINDVVQGLYLGLQTLSQKGDGVIVQPPIYPPFLNAVHETERRLVSVPLVLDANNYQINFDRLESSITKDTRIFMLCNPHNPTGRSFSRTELEQLSDFCCKNNLLVLSDEIHADLILDDTQHVPIASLGGDIARRTVTLMSASKAFNIAGLCLAFAHFGSTDVRKRFDALPGHVRGGTNTLSVAAVYAAWTQGDEWLANTLRVLRENRDLVSQFVMSRWPEVVYQPPEATYLAWLDMSSLNMGLEPYKHFMEKGRVALGNGIDFGSEGGQHVRLNFATSNNILRKILERMDTVIVSNREHQ
jgi:cysteine-S-conjugate beta-lyase